MSVSKALGGALILRQHRATLLLAVMVMASCVVHAHYMIRGLGEPDAARLINQAFVWHETGVFPADTYTNRTSPLYLGYIRLLLAAGTPLASIPYHLNLLGVIASSVTLIPLYALWQRLTGDKSVALVACVVWWFVPAFWLATAYGMPHIPGFLAFVSSLVFFQRAMDASPHRFLTRASLSSAALCVALGLKADLILCALAFLGLVICSRTRSPRNFLASAGIPISALLVGWLFSRALLPPRQSDATFAKWWVARFPFDVQVLSNSAERFVTVESLGLTLWIAASIALLICSLTRFRHLVLLVLLWSIPAIAFWGLILGNSPRHIMASLCPITLIVVVALHVLLRRPQYVAAASAGLIALNYFSSTSTGSALTTRVFAAPERLQGTVDGLHARARAFVRHPANRKLLIGTWTVPYAEYELYTAAKRLTRTDMPPGGAWLSELRIEQSSEQPVIVRIRSQRLSPAERAAWRGWLIWSSELGRPI